MKLHEYINLLPLAANRKEAEAWGKSRPRPAFISGREVTDDDVNLLSFADLVLLAGAGTDTAFIDTLQKVFVIDLYEEEADRALGFITWMSKTVTDILTRFNKTRVPATEEEKAAGVESLQFGFFGTIDWYARRMAITHDQAEQTAWVRIFKCLQMEVKEEIYHRRLLKVREDKAKAQAKKGRRKR